MIVESLVVRVTELNKVSCEYEYENKMNQRREGLSRKMVRWTRFNGKYLCA